MKIKLKILKKQQGITLIALVITIIVLLILAGVSISMLTGENGILSKAKDARDNTKTAAEDEQNKLNDMNSLIEQMSSGNEVSGKTQEEKQQDTLGSLKVLNSKQDDQFYSMSYTADYKFDEYLTQGSNDSNETARFCSENLLDGRTININAAAASCTTFTAKTSDGKNLFGRNMDLVTNSPALILTTDPEDGYKSISTVDIALIESFKNGIPSNVSDYTKEELLVAPYFPLDGMNEAGVTIAILHLNDTPISQNTGKVPITETTLARLVLDKAGSVDEAINLLNKYDMNTEVNSNFHFQISDKSGKSVVVEYINKGTSIEMEVINQNEGKNFQVCSNYYLSPSMSGDIHAEGTAENRYKTAYETLNNKNGILEESEAKNLLKSVRQGTNGSSTQWSIIFNKTDLTLTIAPNGDFDGDFVLNLSL